MIHLLSRVLLPLECGFFFFFNSFNCLQAAVACSHQCTMQATATPSERAVLRPSLTAASALSLWPSPPPLAAHRHMRLLCMPHPPPPARGPMHDAAVGDDGNDNEATLHDGDDDGEVTSPRRDDGKATLPQRRGNIAMTTIVMATMMAARTMMAMEERWWW
ncbi:hypothetical protein EDB86DRAFT_2835466 [Lactarius hatsudake]|nr:hypothetical protein EDB86DRAFT_2835466 [Lactarius hatsudake]